MSTDEDVKPAVRQGNRSHMVIPDLQVRPGVPTQHCDWIGEYIVDRRPDVVVQIGDAFDMASLNHHRKRLELEGARYSEDIECARDAMARILAPAKRHRLKLDARFLDGNHEQMIQEAIDGDPRLEGTISLKDCDVPGWRRHPFLEPVFIDGVGYSHYWYHPMTGRPWTGTIDNRLKHVGHSFTMGHQQTFLYGIRYVAGHGQHGVVAGSCYLHDENYKGPQGNAHWRGVIMKHEVRDGDYDIMPVSLNFLCRKYEGMSLDRFKKLNKIRSSA